MNGKELGTITRAHGDATLVALQTAAMLGHRISVVVEQGVDIISFVVAEPEKATLTTDEKARLDALIADYKSACEAAAAFNASSTQSIVDAIAKLDKPLMTGVPGAGRNRKPAPRKRARK
jgi:hypothetical protein